MKNRDKKVFIIAALAIVIFIMGIGYSALAARLTINATGNIDATWAVEITNLKEGPMIGAQVNGTTTYDSTSATFAVDLQYPGATATFDIEITNNGTIDAILNSVTGIDAVNSAEPTEIQFEVTGISPNTTKLGVNETNIAHITVTWVNNADSETSNELPRSTSKTATINFNYVQDTNS